MSSNSTIADLLICKLVIVVHPVVVRKNTKTLSLLARICQRAPTRATFPPTLLSYLFWKLILQYAVAETAQKRPTKQIMAATQSPSRSWWKPKCSLMY